MIIQVSDDLHWGIQIDPKCLLKSLLDESMLTLVTVPSSTTFADWLSATAGWQSPSYNVVPSSYRCLKLELEYDFPNICPSGLHLQS